MMNEVFFGCHAIVVVAVIFFALKMGKHALIALFAVQMILANLFVTKQMECFGLTVTCSDVYTIGALLSLNLLQEYFGRSYARRAVWTSLMTSLTFVVMSFIHVHYKPSGVDITQSAFKQILCQTPRIVLASLTVSFFTDRLDMKLYAYAKKRWATRSLSSRFFATALVTQLFDTVAFSFAGLYGIVHSMSAIISLSYMIKVIVISTMTPLTALSKRWITAQTAP